MEARLPVFNDRFCASMNVETVFSEFNAIAGREGRASRGKGDAYGAMVALKKLLRTHNHGLRLRHNRKTVYTDHGTYNKTYDNMRRWHMTSPDDPAKRNKPTSESKNKRLLEGDPLTCENRRVRSRHTESLAPVKSV
ncbi:hypothetical protein SDRG_15472 [Saprolegnia diclina VS20]|uniref:Uncharacterized protein n=1 Tax=Saprolegnia diclina (strain VS20) TaxID=1156394 RepID=T0PWR1_SAPDV|nr:hypothetical protein SDRG_15472 [Saprolegnia diclina VS20]EQC26686.1 hypothetical protein SDRG_15472 [Saprolegnia diclina VS20]|eukprot:XP_008619868.1 hypothetical protein SDRG_15472 [Saprolegnia diclina VS20]